MRIGMDARRLTGDRSGVGNYAGNLLATGAFDGHTVLAFTNPTRGASSPSIEVSPETDLEWHPVAPGPGRLLGPLEPVWWLSVSLDQELADHDVECFFGPNFVQPPRYRGASVVVVHDCIHRVRPAFLPRGYRWYLHAFLSRTLTLTDRIITVSETTRQDLRSCYGVPASRVVVAHGAADDRFHPGDRSLERIAALQERYDLPDAFLLYVGNLEPRKNLSTAIEALAKIDADHRPDLVIVGQRHLADSALERTLENSAVSSSVHFLGYVPDDDLVDLYALATAFVYPSYYEGFGLPAVEAMQSGTPVVASNGGALGEVIDGGGHLLDPDDVGGFAREIKSIIEDPSTRDRLSEHAQNRASDFSWERSASRVARAIEEAT